MYVYRPNHFIFFSSIVAKKQILFFVSDIFSVNVWCGIIDNRLIGPYFYRENLNGERYLAFLRDVLPGLLEDLPLDTRQNLIFQQDGAPAHNSLIVRHHLDVVYPGRYMSTHGAIKWPPRSPDLTPLDFHLWGFLKQSVYRERSNTIEELQQRIQDACNSVTAETLQLVTTVELQKRFVACGEADGRHFEQLL